MNGGLDIAASQEAQGVACVDSQAAVERLGPLPVAGLVVPDLQRSHWLAEKKSDCAEIGVATGPKAVVELLNLLWCELGVLHVSQMRLVMDIPLVNTSKEVFRKLQCKSDEMVQGVQDLVMQVLSTRISIRPGHRQTSILPWRSPQSPLCAPPKAWAGAG